MLARTNEALAAAKLRNLLEEEGYLVGLHSSSPKRLIEEPQRRIPRRRAPGHYT